MPSEGRDVIEFGTRRAHTPEAGVLGARAAYIGGCAGTSNVLAGYRFGIPVMGTAAHSWVMSFGSETEAFSDAPAAARREHHPAHRHLRSRSKARASRPRLGKPLWGVRIDSGDLPALSRQVRRILDDAGLRDTRIMASGDLDESKIAALVAAGAPIDAFGVGTELATSADAPSMGAIYKLVEISHAGEIRYTSKRSPEKHTIPGAKQLFRYPEFDLLGLHNECAGGAEAMLKPVIIGGDLVCPLPSVDKIRKRAGCALAQWPSGVRRTEYSPQLQKLLSV